MLFRLSRSTAKSAASDDIGPSPSRKSDVQRRGSIISLAQSTAEVKTSKKALDQLDKNLSEMRAKTKLYLQKGGASSNTHLSWADVWSQFSTVIRGGSTSDYAEVAAVDADEAKSPFQFDTVV